jgi:RNA polymerase sigma-70 factor (ECF subfamily)
MTRQVARVAARDEARASAFSQLANDRLVSMYRLSAAVLGDPTEAEDATHDAAVKAWEGWGSLRDVDRFDAWFQRILINECRDRLRRRPQRRELALADNDLDVDGADEAAQVAERASLALAMRELTPDQRIAIVLRYYMGFDVDEIAHRAGARPGTVKSRIHYALRALRATRDAATRLS